MDITRVIVVVLAAVLLAACGPPAGDGAGPGAQPPEPTGAPYIEGELTSLTPSTEDDRQGTILVEEPGDGNKASLTVLAGVGIWRETPGGLEAARFADLAVGQTVAAWVSGPVMESFPVQAGADAVVIRP